jgi:hypothetical protein
MEKIRRPKPPGNYSDRESDCEEAMDLAIYAMDPDPADDVEAGV